MGLKASQESCFCKRINFHDTAVCDLVKGVVARTKYANNKGICLPPKDSALSPVLPLQGLCSQKLFLWETVELPPSA